MKNIFLSIAVATTVCALAQNPTQSTRPINRASEWSKESALESKKIDSSKLIKKTITQEIALPKALDILIDMSGELIISTWNENKIKIETTVQFEEPNELTDAQWLDKLGINMKVFGSTVKVKSKSNNVIVYFNNGASTFSSISISPAFNNGTYFNMQKGARPVILYIPAESILEIESKYGNLKIRNNIKSLLLDNTDGEIEFANIEKLQIRSNRGSFSGGIVTEADIELSHARFALKQLNNGTLTSNYSTIEIESLKDVKLSSSSDDIDVDNVSALYGIKNYGNLSINQLIDKLDLQGINSDIKLRHINSSAQLVKIVNRNADLRLSANDLSNFSVDIKGSYNKVYSSFAENTTVDTLTTAEIESVKALTNAATTVNPARIIGTTNNRYSSEENLLVKALTKAPTTVSPVRIIGTTNSRYSSAENLLVSTITGYGIGVNKQNPYLKYSAKRGTGNSPKYQIICTSCVIDFK